jgi:alkanesulfonate monooxygenase SsuD/methylene tetrahydromethanopterin reductase-like flavin-dependent oxidoreductase (luciferase family)
MRALWTQDVVTFEGKYHTLNHVSIKPRPSRPVPVWIGGMSEKAIKRAVRLGDGWFPQFRPDAPDPQGTIDRFFSLLRESGRDPDDFGIQTTFPFGGSPDDWHAHVEQAASWGATHLSVNTMGIGLSSPREHIAKIEEIRQVID